MRGSDIKNIQLNATTFKGMSIENFVKYQGMLSDSSLNLNSFTEPGYYDFAFNALPANFPTGLYQYGEMLVCGKHFPLQLYFPHRKGEFAYRVMYGNNWQPWTIVGSSTSTNSLDISQISIEGGGYEPNLKSEVYRSVKKKGGLQHERSKHRQPSTGSSVCSNISYSRRSCKYDRLVRSKSKSKNWNLPYLYCYSESSRRRNRSKHNTYPLQLSKCTTDIYYSPNSQNLYPGICRWRVGFLDKTGFYNRCELITSWKEVVVA